MFKFSKFAALRKKLMFINVFLIICGLSVIGTSLFVYVTLTSRISDMKNKYGDEMKSINEFHTTLKAGVKDINDLKAKVDQKLKTDEEAYLDKIKYAIVGYYGFTGQKKSQSEADWIGESVRISFECAEVLWIKNAIKHYGPNIRVIAIQNLGEKRVETNFNKDCVSNNYEKTGDGKFLIYKDKSRFVKKIANSPDCEVFTTDWKTSIVCPFNDIIDRLNVLSTDFGENQVNSVHTKPAPSDNIYTTLSKIGVWRMDMNKWIMDPKINCYARMVINEERTANWVNKPFNRNPKSADEPGNGHWDKVLVEMLLKVDGWQSIDKYR